MELELEPLNLPCDNERPFVIAGPCSAETEEQVMTTAKQLADKGCHMFRAGVWKPRTKPGGFEGNGEAALPWLKAVKEETGMLIATEVATPEHVELCLKYGLAVWSALIRQALSIWQLFIVDSQAMTRRFIATFQCGRFLSSCVAVFLTSLSSATQATSVVVASLSHHYVSRLWTLASMVLSLRAIATQIVHGAMLSSRLHQMSSTTSSAFFRCAANL